MVLNKQPESRGKTKELKKLDEEEQFSFFPYT